MTDVLTVLRKHRSKGALVAANLLLVYAVGTFDPYLLRAFDHTKQYAEEFPLIEYIIRYFSKLYTTPNIVTEVSNLGGKLGEPLYNRLGTLVNALDERYCTSADSVKVPQFAKLGRTDAGIIDLAAAGILVLTVDVPLYMILQHRNVDAVNFNHLRPLNW